MEPQELNIAARVNGVSIEVLPRADYLFVETPGPTNVEVLWLEPVASDETAVVVTVKHGDEVQVNIGLTEDQARWFFDRWGKPTGVDQPDYRASKE
ncbi:MAG: hypothetical protein KDA89_25745 [Planctomycetaceae bacterium]|nr:hypothetical protein [Planctomycetaceae bacterium]